MLTQFYDIENKAGNVIVENIGRAAKSSDAARFLHFHVSKREPDGSPTRKSTRTSRPPPSPEKERLTDLQRYFVPDLVMLTGQTGQKIHEVLTVEVKSGKVLLEIDETQLKYMMLPLVIEQNVAVGLLICANMATILKARVDGGEILYGSKSFSFCSDHLDEDMATVLAELNSHILDCKILRERKS